MISFELLQFIQSVARESVTHSSNGVFGKNLPHSLALSGGSNRGIPGDIDLIGFCQIDLGKTKKCDFKVEQSSRFKINSFCKRLDLKLFLHELKNINNNFIFKFGRNVAMNKLNFNGNFVDIQILTDINFISQLSEGDYNCLEVLFNRPDNLIIRDPLIQKVFDNSQMFLNWVTFDKLFDCGNRLILDGIEQENYKRCAEGIRILSVIEQLLICKKFTTDAGAEVTRFIRDGNWNMGQIHKFYENKKIHLKKLYGLLKMDYPECPNIDMLKCLITEKYNSYE